MVSMDLEKYRYLNAGVVRSGYFERTAEGFLKGGPLSLFLVNIMLNERC